jgi:hypothetical protein
MRQHFRYRGKFKEFFINVRDIGNACAFPISLFYSFSVAIAVVVVDG